MSKYNQTPYEQLLVNAIGDALSGQNDEGYRAAAAIYVYMRHHHMDTRSEHDDEEYNGDLSGVILRGDNMYLVNFIEAAEQDLLRYRSSDE